MYVVYGNERRLKQMVLLLVTLGRKKRFNVIVTTHRNQTKLALLNMTKHVQIVRVKKI